MNTSYAGVQMYITTLYKMRVESGWLDYNFYFLIHTTLMHAVNFIETEYIMYFIFQIKTSFG